MKSKWLVLLLGLAMAVFVAGCGDDDGDNPTGPSSVAEFEVIQISLDTYVDSDRAPTILAQALFENLNDGDSSNDPVILSVRSADHYAAGHIPGAVNIPWRGIGDAAKLATLPQDRQIVVYCYTGHTGGVATTALNAMGYDAVNLKFGMMSWTKDAEVRVSAPFSEDMANDFSIETIQNSPGTYSLADPDYTDSDAEEEIVRAAVNGYVVEKGPVILAQALFDNLSDGDDSNDPVVMSVRSAAHYAIGHVPGAINIPWREITEIENLEKLPTDRQIVVYCYTGHTGAVVTTALNMLGYDAFNMKFGMGSWTRDAEVRVAATFSEDMANDFPIER